MKARESCIDFIDNELIPKLKAELKNQSSEQIISQKNKLLECIEEYTDVTYQGQKIKIPYYKTPFGTKLYGGKKTPLEIKQYLDKQKPVGDLQKFINRKKRYTGIDCSGLVAYVLNESSNGKLLEHWNTTYAFGIPASKLTNISQGKLINKASDIVAGCTMRTAKGRHVIVIYDVIRTNGIVTAIKYAHSNGSKAPHKGYVEIGDPTKDLGHQSQTWHDIAYTDKQAKKYYNHTILLHCVNGYIS